MAFVYDDIQSHKQECYGGCKMLLFNEKVESLAQFYIPLLIYSGIPTGHQPSQAITDRSYHWWHKLQSHKVL